MTFPHSAEVLEQMRRLAMLRLEEGYSQAEVAEFLDVSPRTIRRWWRAWQSEGEASLPPGPRSGRPAKLTARQTERVLGWLDRHATEFQFLTERWTAVRLAGLIERHCGVVMNPRYLNDWLRAHGVTPQMPGRQARQRDEKLIAGWTRHQWPRIKKSAGI